MCYFCKDFYDIGYGDKNRFYLFMSKGKYRNKLIIWLYYVN